MSYYELLEKQEQAKLALITDTKAYSYGELVAEAAKIRKTADFGEKAIFIHEDTIAAQLIKFVAYSGTKTVPIIATEASKKQHFELENIPKAAVMGVMTSGSTGKSKLLWRNFGSWADFFPEQNRVFGITAATVMFCQGSLAFTGNLNMYMGVLSAGGTLVATEKFRPKHWLEQMERYGVNAIYMIPSKLLLLPKQANCFNEGIKVIVSGSQTMGREEADKLLKVFPKADITLYYGASELNYITYIKGCKMTKERTDIGLPFKGVGIEIREEEIFIDTPYHVENVEVPFSLKDRGYLDEQQHLHFLGRTDDICSVNGLKISTLKVESAIKELPRIQEAAVLSMHVGDSDILTAFVSLEEQAQALDRLEMLQLLRQSFLEEYEIPKHYVFLPELPKNESGKLNKRSLAEWKI